MSESDDVFSDDLDDDAINLMFDNKARNIPIAQSTSTNLSNNPQDELTNDNYHTNNSSTSMINEYVEIETPKIPLDDQPTHHEINYQALSNYIYPTNLEIRDYQFNIVEKALYHNLLVALPTGLGKTFIASTVMLNFFRWFPNSRIIFMAPTKPLVAQQIKACCGITGMPSSKVAILLDKTKKNRAEIWHDKQIFFTTPQVVENDLTTGILNPKSVVLLVIDEAHRSRGNYAYNNVCQFIRRFNQSFRVLALTATPASDMEGVQEIINNLQISKIEVRTEKSIDIMKYMKRKKIERITVNQSPDILKCIELIIPAISPVLKTCNDRKIYEISEPLKINAFQAMEASQRIIKNPTIPEGLKWSNYFLLQLLGVVGQCFRRLNIYGIRSFYNYFYEKQLEFTTKYKNKKSTNHTAADFYMHENILELLSYAKELTNDKNFISHPKIEILIEELKKFYTENSTESKIIIFTEFRESALDIVNSIENLKIDNLNPHIFIGQAKEKEKFDETKFLQKYKKKKKKKDTEDPAPPKKDDKVSKRSSTRTSSEDAQMKGMNQKLQKELIKDFKKGKYNILVATSIGEEGLDIGEVDLIVCFDSTSSPIKNIQRMGRTGRKRDGKVILLFSSNEELKFDKAMDGYDRIQQHIMKDNLIELCERNRIIPKEFKPIVEKKFIEIPPENFELKIEDDEDEIIKIATNYMNQKSSNKASTKSKNQIKNKNKNTKIKKTFYMPDNVETGFKTVTSMIKKKGDELSIADLKKRDRDLLDDLLDSEGEPSQKARDMSNEKLKYNQELALDGSTMETSITIDEDNDDDNNIVDGDDTDNKGEDESNKNILDEITPQKSFTSNSKVNEVTNSESPVDTATRSSELPKSVHEIGQSRSIASSSHESTPLEESDLSTITSKPIIHSTRKSLGTKRKSLKVQKSITDHIDYADDNPHEDDDNSSRATKYNSSSLQAPKPIVIEKRIGKTLGTKRRKPTIIDQLKEQRMKAQEYNLHLCQAIEESNRHNLSNRKSEPSFNEKSEPISLDSDDDFNDGLDEEILFAIKKSSTSSISPQPEESSMTNKSDKKLNYFGSNEPDDDDVVFEENTDPNYGLLNEREQFELYTYYFVNLKSSDKLPYYDPSDGIKTNIENQNKFKNYNQNQDGGITHPSHIGHSKTTISLLRAFDPKLKTNSKDVFDLKSAINSQSFGNDQQFKLLENLVVMDDDDL